MKYFLKTLYSLLLVILILVIENSKCYNNAFRTASNAMMRDSEIMSCMQQEQSGGGFNVFSIHNNLEVVECKAKRCFDRHYSQSYYREGNSHTHKIDHPDNPNLGCKVMQIYEHPKVKEIYLTYICPRDPKRSAICKTDL